MEVFHVFVETSQECFEDAFFWPCNFQTWSEDIFLCYGELPYSFLSSDQHLVLWAISKSPFTMRVLCWCHVLWPPFFFGPSHFLFLCWALCLHGGLLLTQSLNIPQSLSYFFSNSTYTGPEFHCQLYHFSFPGLLPSLMDNCFLEWGLILMKCHLGLSLGNKEGT